MIRIFKISANFVVECFDVLVMVSFSEEGFHVGQ